MTTTLSIALASVNNGSAMLSIKELSVDGEKFALWYHDANQYNMAARWIALGIWAVGKVEGFVPNCSYHNIPDCIWCLL